jgi:hypothetical protein
VLQKQHRRPQSRPQQHTLHTTVPQGRLPAQQQEQPGSCCPTWPLSAGPQSLTLQGCMMQRRTMSVQQGCHQQQLQTQTQWWMCRCGSWTA